MGLHRGPLAIVQLSLLLQDLRKITMDLADIVQESRDTHSLDLARPKSKRTRDHLSCVGYPTRVARGVGIASLDRLHHELKQLAVGLLQTQRRNVELSH